MQCANTSVGVQVQPAVCSTVQLDCSTVQLNSSVHRTKKQENKVTPEAGLP